MGRILPPPIPDDKPISSRKISIYKFSEYIDLCKNSDFDEKYEVDFPLFIDNLELIKNNYDLFQAIYLKGKFMSAYSNDYECLKFIEEQQSEKENINLMLVDDLENKSRSYIKPSEFEKTSLVLPLSYILWCDEFKDKHLFYTHSSIITGLPANLFFENYFTKDDLLRVKDIIADLSSKCANLSDVEKNIVVSDYLQNLVQYVDKNNTSTGQKGIYITDSKGFEIDIPNKFQYVLFHNCGVCGAIAKATNILLNNPLMNVNIRVVRGSEHYWNIVKIDDKYYYVDNTWAITRNNNQYFEALKAQKFTDDYLLFGQDKADLIGHHISEALIPPVSNEDYSREELKEAQKKLVNICKFKDYQKPVFDSYIKRG